MADYREVDYNKCKYKKGQSLIYYDAMCIRFQYVIVRRVESSVEMVEVDLASRGFDQVGQTMRVTLENGVVLVGDTENGVQIHHLVETNLENELRAVLYRYPNEHSQLARKVAQLL